MQHTRSKAFYIAAISLLFLTCFLGYLYYSNKSNTSIGNLTSLSKRFLSHFIGSKTETSSAQLQMVENPNSGDKIKKLSDSRGQQNALISKTDEVTFRQHEIEQLQAQLLEFKALKASSDNQISRLISRYDELVTELKEQESTKEWGTASENVVYKKDNMLPQLEQKLKELEDALNEKKISNNRLRIDLSEKAAMVSELQKKLETSQYNYLKLEAEIAKSKEKITQLQEQLSGLKTKQVPVTSSPVISRMRGKDPPESDKSKLNPILKAVKDIMGH
jgi:chromosome segregation ATPase